MIFHQSQTQDRIYIVHHLIKLQHSTISPIPTLHVELRFIYFPNLKRNYTIHRQNVSFLKFVQIIRFVCLILIDLPNFVNYWSFVQSQIILCVLKLHHINLLKLNCSLLAIPLINLIFVL